MAALATMFAVTGGYLIALPQFTGQQGVGLVGVLLILTSCVLAVLADRKATSR